MFNRTNMKIALAKRNWTQEDIAKCLNCSKQVVSYRMCGKNLWTLNDIDKLKKNGFTNQELYAIFLAD